MSRPAATTPIGPTGMATPPAGPTPTSGPQEPGPNREPWRVGASSPPGRATRPTRRPAAVPTRPPPVDPRHRPPPRHRRRRLRHRGPRPGRVGPAAPRRRRARPPRRADRRRPTSPLPRPPRGLVAGSRRRRGSPRERRIHAGCRGPRRRWARFVAVGSRRRVRSGRRGRGRRRPRRPATATVAVNPRSLHPLRLVALGARARRRRAAHDEPVPAGVARRGGVAGRGRPSPRRAVGAFVRLVRAPRRRGHRSCASLLQVLFGVRLPGHVLFTLPSVDLPDWAAGVTLGGPVTAEALVVGVQRGTAAGGAARLRRRREQPRQPVPIAAFDAGRALRARRGRDRRAVVRPASRAERAACPRRPPAARPTAPRVGRVCAAWRCPVLEGALERSLAAGGVDGQPRLRPACRGVAHRTAPAHPGRGADRRSGARRSACTACSTAARPVGLGFPMLAVGAVLLVASLAPDGARSTRTRYRPDPWRVPEWVHGGRGCASRSAALVVAGQRRQSTALHPAYSPLDGPAAAPAPGRRRADRRPSRAR